MLASRLGAKTGDAEVTAAWDSERWDRELQQDLLDGLTRISEQVGDSTTAALDPGGTYTVRRALAFLGRVAGARAAAFNAGTLAELIAAVETAAAEGRPRSTAIRDAFEVDADPLPGREESGAARRAALWGATVGTFAVAWSRGEAARQTVARHSTDDPEEEWVATKRWQTTSSRPRKAHARLNGETVALDDQFSNGLDWPGGYLPGHPEQVAGCRCKAVVTAGPASSKRVVP